jgi:hypothetical protein
VSREDRLYPGLDQGRSGKKLETTGMIGSRWLTGLQVIDVEEEFQRMGTFNM